MGNSDYKVSIPSLRQTVTTEESIPVLYYTGTQWKLKSDTNQTQDLTYLIPDSVADK